MEFPAVEIQVKKWKETSNLNQLEGRWVTKLHLTTIEGWSKQLAFMQFVFSRFPQEDGRQRFQLGIPARPC